VPLVDRHFKVLLALFIVSIPLITSRIYSGDEIQYYAYLRSAWMDHDLQFANEYQWIVDQAPAKQEHFKQAFLDHKNETGYTRNDAPIGCAILWAPFFLIADIFARVTGSATNGFSAPYIRMICFASAFYGFIGFLLQYKIARRYFDDWNAFWGVLSLWLGAHAIFYMYVTPPMSHATSIFTTSLFLFVWLNARERESAAAWFLLGLCGGLAAIVRWQDALFLILPLFDKRAVRLKLIFLLAVALIFVPQLAVWKILNGGFHPYSTGNLKGKFFWYAKYFFPALFSTYHGLFVWTPLVALCIAGFCFLAKRDPVFRWMILVFILEFYSIVSLDTWQGGSGFGLRYMISCTAIFTFGLVAMYAKMPRKLVPVIAIFFIVWNCFMVIQASTGMIPRDAHFPISLMLQNQFVEVPKHLVEILSRFLFHRSSFYAS